MKAYLVTTATAAGQVATMIAGYNLRAVRPSREREVTTWGVTVARAMTAVLFFEVR